MKIPALAFVLSVAAGLAAQTGTAPPARTYPDVLTSQTNAGIALTAYKSTLEGYVTQDGIDIAALKAKPSSVPAVDPYTYLATSNVTAITEPGVCAPAHDFTAQAAGQYADYSVTVPVAGAHQFFACVASAATSWSFHFEYPVGTNLGSLSQASIASPLNNWSVFRQVPSAMVTLPAGSITVRVVFETTTFNFGGFSVQ